MYFAIAVALFSGSRYYLLILGAAILGVAILLVQSLVAAWVSSLTVTENAIGTVTSVGGIIRIRFDELDWEQTRFSDACLLLVPRDGESLMVSVAEYSRTDIARIARHVADSCARPEMDPMTGPDSPSRQT